MVLPKELKERLKPEELKGVYIPFWMIDAQAHSQYQVEIGIHWYEEEEYTTTENGKTVTKTRRVRRTEWHSLSGTFAKEYSNIWSVVLLVFRQKKVWSYNPLMSVFA